jgi:hypothetical protein
VPPRLLIIKTRFDSLAETDFLKSSAQRTGKGTHTEYTREALSVLANHPVMDGSPAVSSAPN